MQHHINRAPGVYRQDIYPSAPVEFRTGVPAFLGFTHAGEDKIYTPQILNLWPQFEDHFGKPLSCGFLGHAVRGFFENGGNLCYVVALDGSQGPEEALRRGLDALEPFDIIDLVCAPDIMMNEVPVVELQNQVLDHCERSGDRLAILDSRPFRQKDYTLEEAVKKVSEQRKSLFGKNGALYFPWLGVRTKNDAGQFEVKHVPPCGHIAGIYARTDEQVGVHKAPANEVIQGVVDLEVTVSEAQQAKLNPAGINCLRAFPGRGIRVWGARTLSKETAWTYVNVRRLFLTAGRWIEHHMTAEVFEPHTPDLWARITGDLNVYFNDLFQKGALQGASPEEAFYVKCDAETNPPQVQDEGRVVAEIGLAPNRPNEFVIVRIIHGAGGVTIAGPSGPA